VIDDEQENGAWKCVLNLKTAGQAKRKNKKVRTYYESSQAKTNKLFYRIGFNLLLSFFSLFVIFLKMFRHSSLVFLTQLQSLMKFQFGHMSVTRHSTSYLIPILL
jgi:hypothetical protein